MTKLQNVGGYGILAIPTLPAMIVFFHAIRGTLGGALVSSAPTELRVPSHRIHRFYRYANRNILTFCGFGVFRGMFLTSPSV